MLTKLGLANFRKLVAYIAGMAALLLSSLAGIGDAQTVGGIFSVDRVVELAVMIVTGFGVYKATNSPS